MKVVCISGKARSGKDTTAQILKEQLESEGNAVLIIHYADYLKFICKNYFGWNGLKDEVGRHMLQYVGTDVVRAMDENFWVNKVIELLKLFGHNYDYVLIPDARFPNEIESMKSEFQTFSIRVYRNGLNMSDETKNHESETALDNYVFDYKIENFGSKEDLFNAIIDVKHSIELE